MKNDLKNIKLYAITDSGLLKNKSLGEAVREAILGGADMIQLREKNASGEELRKLAKEVLEVTREYNIPLIINDDPELCAEVGADGVHIGQNDMDIISARRILGNDKIIGVSAKTAEQAVYAEKNGADYIGVGAAFGTDSKKDAACIPHEMYSIIRNAVSLPIIAIGGINKYNIEALKGLGINGAAVISAIFGNENIEGNSKELKLLCEMFFDD